MSPEKPQMTSIDTLQPVEAIPDLGSQSQQDSLNPVQKAVGGNVRDQGKKLVPSNSSSMIKLDVDASEGESLDSHVVLAMQEANRL